MRSQAAKTDLIIYGEPANDKVMEKMTNHNGQAHKEGLMMDEILN